VTDFWLPRQNESHKFTDFFVQFVALPLRSSGLVEDGFITGNFDASPTATPEPSSFLLLGTGLLGFVGLMRKRFV
jgi:hypothetical protein